MTCSVLYLRLRVYDVALNDEKLITAAFSRNFASVCC
jgi:hypothetical protein